MPAQAANLFRLEHLDASGARELAESDRNALRAVAELVAKLQQQNPKLHGSAKDWP
jgi:hypothetical protein